MSPNCLVRKRIWEVNCVSLDSVIAATFDWRELANFLLGAGHTLKLKQPQSVLELQVQNLIHQHCHSENPLSLKVEQLLNHWYQGTIEEFSILSVEEMTQRLMTEPVDHRIGGILWAIGSDSREGLDCVQRRFHQRIQVASARRWLAKYTVSLEE